MEIIDKYIYAIGQKLPIKGRNEIKMELKSLILDEIESKYGKNPTKDELESSILSFGTPSEVARKYNSNDYIIHPGLYELYFLLIKIIAGALTIAFTTIFIVSMFTEPHTGTEVLKELVKIPLRTFQAFLGGVGSISLIFILITKFGKESEINIDKDWSIKELDGVELSPQTESKIESIIAITLIPIFLTLVIVYPEIIQFLENTFEKSTLLLGHRVNMELFRSIVPLFVIEGLIEIIYHIIVLKKGEKTKGLKILYMASSGASLIVAILLLNMNNLFIYAGGVNTGLFTHSTVGFKFILLISLIVSSIELVAKLVKYIIDSLSS